MIMKMENAKTTLNPETDNQKNLQNCPRWWKNSALTIMYLFIWLRLLRRKKQMEVILIL